MNLKYELQLCEKLIKAIIHHFKGLGAKQEVESEGAVEAALLKECPWMEKSMENLEGEDDEASQQHRQVRKQQSSTAQTEP